MNLKTEKVLEALQALNSLKTKKSSTQAELLSEEVPIQLNITFHKIPKVKDQRIKVPLPHSLVRSTTSVCLFCKDLKKKGSDPEESKEHFEELLQENGITDIEVIPLKTLKQEYIAYEAKRNLSNMYDVFLSDNRIAHLLPSFLGKHFYGRKKVPKEVNLESKKLKEEIDHTLSLCQCEVSGRGSTCTAIVGHTGQKDIDVVENILTAVNKIGSSLPGGSENFKCLHLKTTDSPALLIYYSTVSPNDVKMPEETEKPSLIAAEAEEVTTVTAGKVRVLKDGTVQVINSRTKRLYNKRGELRKGVHKMFIKTRNNSKKSRENKPVQSKKPEPKESTEKTSTKTEKSPGKKIKRKRKDTESDEIKKTKVLKKDR